jgi:Flp pilus assembly protein TadD
VQTLGQRSRPKVLSLGLSLILTGIFSASCIRKQVRTKVTEEDVLRANQASQDGDVSFGRKDYYAALIKYLEAVRLNPNNGNMFNRLGIIYSQLKLYEEARGAFQRAIELNPKSFYAINNLGSVYFAQRNLKKAEKYFRKALSLKGDEASFHMNLGSIYLEKKKADKAMAEWRKALALDPDILSKNNAIVPAGGNSNATMEREYFTARLYALSGNAEAAIESLKRAIANGFSDVEAIEKQHDLDPIRQDAHFEEFMKDVSLLIKLRSKVGLPADTSGPPAK